MPSGASGRIRWILALLAAAVAVPGCGPDRASIVEAVDSYIRAVDERDVERLVALSAPLAETLAETPEAEEPAVVESYRDYLRSRYAAYETARDQGQLDFQPDGVVLLRALNLGSGAFYQNVEVSVPGPDRAVVIQEVRLGYRSIDVFALPRGTTLYFLGEPFGTIYAAVLGERKPGVRRLLDKVWLRWTLARRGGRWLIARVEPDPERPPEWYKDTTRF